MNKASINIIGEKSNVDPDLAISTSKAKDALSTKTDDEYSSISIGVPPVLYFNELKLMSCVKFDKNLMTVEVPLVTENNSKETTKMLTPIPKFIAYLILTIRIKFEDELRKRVCFLESNALPSNEEITKMAKLVYYKSRCLDNVLKFTSGASCTLLFCTLLEILQKLENKLLQFSEETYLFLQNESIFEPCRPYDYVISSQLCDYITTTYLKKKKTVKKLKNKEEDPTLTSLSVLVKSYYNTQGITKQARISLRNKFNMLIYRDFRMVKNSMQRYLFRFILRQCIYIIRRYVGVVSGRLRMLRKESWKTAQQTVVPYVNTFAVHRMANFLASTITEIKGPIDNDNSRKKVLENLLYGVSEKLWQRQKTISEVMDNNDPFYCHKNCVCGMG